MSERVRNAASLGESHFREYKSAIEGPPTKRMPRALGAVRRDIAEALIAFANADGGELLVGVEDDGRLTGVPHGSEKIELMLRAPEDLVLAETPLHGVIRSSVQVEQISILYFSVPKSSDFVHQLADGRCMRRRDVETIPAVASVLRLDREEEASREYDREYIDGATLTDLDLDLVQQASDVISRGSTPEMMLQQLNLADFSAGILRLRRAALLLFAKEIDRWHPRCAVRLIRVDGSQLLTGTDYNVVVDSTVSGPIVRVIGDAWDLVRPHLSRTSLSDRGRFEESILFPEDACLEAIVNAIAHRSYASEGRLIEVYVYPDRLEVVSPGRLLQTVTVEALKAGGGVHESRNTLVARVLRELGFMREMGEGIRRMFTLMRLHDLVDPEFINESESFTSRLANRSSYPPEALQWLSGYKRFSLTRAEERVVLLGADDKLLSPSAIMKALGMVDSDDYREIATKLQSKGLLYPTVNKTQTSALARRQRKRPRDIARMRIRPPAEAVAFLDEMVMAIRQDAASFPLTRAEVGTIRKKLGPSSPYSNRDNHLYDSLRVLDLIDGQGQPSGELSNAFPEAHGGTNESDSEPETRDGPQPSIDVARHFHALYDAAEALGVELTLQYAGTRLRGKLGPEAYADAVGSSGLRALVDAIGGYEVIEDHGRHTVRRP